MDSSPALQKYTEEKLKEKISKFVTKPIEAKVSFSVQRHSHTAHCSLVAGDGFDLEVEHTCADMYGSVDHIADKLVSQLKRQKEKLKDHKPEKHRRAAREVFAEADGDGVDAEDILKYEQAKRRAFGT
jgi:putative sigma-54 modulation protein